jgi:hypothetical protein
MKIENGPGRARVEGAAPDAAVADVRRASSFCRRRSAGRRARLVGDRRWRHPRA